MAIAAVSDVVGTLGWRKTIEQRSNGLTHALHLVRTQVVHDEMTRSPGRNSGASLCSVQATKISPLMGPSSTQGAAKPSWRNAHTKVLVCQWPCGARPMQRTHLAQRACVEVMLVVAQVSSRNTRWLFCRRVRAAAQLWRAAATSARSCSLAYKVFFKTQVQPAKPLPQGRDYHTYAVLALGYCANRALRAENAVAQNLAHKPVPGAMP